MIWEDHGMFYLLLTYELFVTFCALSLKSVSNFKLVFIIMTHDDHYDGGDDETPISYGASDMYQPFHRIFGIHSL